MTRRDDYLDDMADRDHSVDMPHAPGAFGLDMQTAERLLRAGLDIDDTPPSFRGVAATLLAIRATPTAAELEREEQGVADFLHGLADGNRETAARPVRTRRRSTRRLQLVAAATVAGATLMFGLAAAGALPGAAQRVAHDMLDSIGISVPGPDSRAGVHPEERGRSGDQPASREITNGSSNPNGGSSSTNSGATNDPSNPGKKGSSTPNGNAPLGGDNDVSVPPGAANGNGNENGNGNGQAGEHGSGGAQAPVGVPNDGGTGTADSASDGNSSKGTQTADSNSDGRSTAGSGNAAG